MKKKACKGCTHRVECLYEAELTTTIEVTVETFQMGDKTDDGTFYLSGCIGEVNQALEKFWNKTYKLFENLQRRINHG